MVELMKIPSSIFMEVSFTGKVYNKMNEFFINTKDYLKEQLSNVNDYDFKIRNGEIKYKGNNSDEKIILLSYLDKIVAGMVETRTMYNDLQFSFFRNLDWLIKK